MDNIDLKFYSRIIPAFFLNFFSSFFLVPNQGEY